MKADGLIDMKADGLFDMKAIGLIDIRENDVIIYDWIITGKNLAVTLHKNM